MPNYKKYGFFSQINSPDFDIIHTPGTPAPYAGIYRCNACRHEIAIADGHVLPPQNHGQHPQSLPIRWQLVAAAVNR